TEFKRRAAQVVRAQFTLNGQEQSLEDVRFAYGKPGRGALVPVYAIGSARSSGGSYTLDLATIESLTVSKQDAAHHSLTITAVIFPDISPAGLVKLQPT